MDRLIDFIDFFQAKYVALFFAVVSFLEFLYIRFMVKEYHELEKKYKDLKGTYDALKKEHFDSSKNNKVKSAVIITDANSQLSTTNKSVSKSDLKATPSELNENTEYRTNEQRSTKLKRHEEKKQHFYLKANNKSVFVKWSDSIDDESKFKATLISENKATIELIDVNRIKSLPGIGEVVFESGTIQLKDAVSFKPIASGVIIKEQQGPTAYWKIDEKIKVEYTK